MFLKPGIAGLLMADSDSDSEQLARWIGAATLGLLDRARRFDGKSVVLAGQLPFARGDIAGLIPPAASVHVDELPDGLTPDYIVIGQDGARLPLLDQCIEAAAQDTRFLPQEGFLDEVLFGFDWWVSEVDQLNDACNYYTGLAYVRSQFEELGFEWPSSEANSVPEVIGPDDKTRMQETELYRRGYNVARGTNRARRWAVLRRIIEGSEMPLQEVVGTIASHCRARRRQHGGEEKYSRALGEWEFDLQRLKTTYYDGRPSSFSWPRAT